MEQISVAVEDCLRLSAREWVQVRAQMGVEVQVEVQVGLLRYAFHCLARILWAPYIFLL